jgi:spore coat protein CotH
MQPLLKSRMLDSLLGPRQNHYVYLHPKTQKFMFLPWDQDQTFGQFPRERPTNRDARISAFRSPLSPSSHPQSLPMRCAPGSLRIPSQFTRRDQITPHGASCSADVAAPGP